MNCCYLYPFRTIGLYRSAEPQDVRSNAINVQCTKDLLVDSRTIIEPTLWIHRKMNQFD